MLNQAPTCAWLSAVRQDMHAGLTKRIHFREAAKMKLRRADAGRRQVACGKQLQKTQAFGEAQNNINRKGRAASSPCLKAGAPAA
jgi:hypothetical protein